MRSGTQRHTLDPALAEDEIECRICKDGVSAGPLISPCGCRGSLEHVHLACLLRWLRHSHGARRTAPVCQVCLQPIDVAVPNLMGYLAHRLRRPRAAAHDAACACIKYCEHVLYDPDCGHVHCLALRWLIALGALQLAAWAGQVLLLLAFEILRMSLELDIFLDSLLVPPVLLPALHKLLPPMRILGDGTVGFSPELPPPISMVPLHLTSYILQ